MKRVFVLFLSLGSFWVTTTHAGMVCVDLFKDKTATKQLYRSSEMTEQVLSSLVGATISYSGKYVYRDPSDKRQIIGEGIVLSTALWSRDRSPSFSVKLMLDSGERRNVQVFIDDPTFLLKVEEPSKLSSFVDLAKQDGLKLHMTDIHFSDISAAKFYRDPAHQNLRIAFLSATGNKNRPYELQEIASTATKVPSDQDIALSFILNRKPLELEFQTNKGSLNLRPSDIIAVAF